jgi:hypothetical protein
MDTSTLFARVFHAFNTRVRNVISYRMRIGAMSDMFRETQECQHAEQVPCVCLRNTISDLET